MNTLRTRLRNASSCTDTFAQRCFAKRGCNTKQYRHLHTSRGTRVHMQQHCSDFVRVACCSSYPGLHDS
eukprot:4248634-Alexandrium_andersonii.AAC.1